MTEGLPIVAQGWQPIETAPRDGTEVLVCVTHNLPDDEWETIIWTDNYHDEDWFRWSDRIDIPFPPTHWMPLPAPPSTRPPQTNPIIAGSGEEIVEELHYAAQEMLALPRDKRDEMEMLTNFSAEAIAHLYTRTADFIEAQQATIRGLVEALEKANAHIHAMQEMATRFLVPEPYTDREGVVWSDSDPEPFASDIIWMLDGPEQREVQANIDRALSIVRPEPQPTQGNSSHD